LSFFSFLGGHLGPFPAGSGILSGCFSSKEQRVKEAFLSRKGVKTMAGKQYKQLSCGDFGDECAFLVRAETEEEVLRVGFDHACRVHGKCEGSNEMESKARSLIKNISV
jgi:predicted small metal-binding protein